jgi:hypothetical protein
MKKMNGYLPKEVLGKAPKCFKVRVQIALFRGEIRAAIKLQESLKNGFKL